MVDAFEATFGEGDDSTDEGKVVEPDVVDLDRLAVMAAKVVGPAPQVSNRYGGLDGDSSGQVQESADTEVEPIASPRRASRKQGMPPALPPLPEAWAVSGQVSARSSARSGKKSARKEQGKGKGGQRFSYTDKELEEAIAESVARNAAEQAAEQARACSAQWLGAAAAGDDAFFEEAREFLQSAGADCAKFADGAQLREAWLHFAEEQAAIERSATDTPRMGSSSSSAPRVGLSSSSAGRDGLPGD